MYYVITGYFEQEQEQEDVYLYCESSNPDVYYCAARFQFSLVVFPVLTNSNMNGCRRLASTTGDWRSGWLFGCHIKTRTDIWPCSGAAALTSKRGQSTAAGEAPSTDTREKPRLRAIDLARKVQEEKAKTREAEPQLTQLQRRTVELKRFTQQLQNVHPNVLAKHLHKSVLYQDQDIVIINKPYGVPVKGKTTLHQATATLSCH